MSLESLPKSLRGLRACLLCSMIKSIDQFEQDGCDNCEEFLKMKNNRDVVYDCTSQNFDGMVAMMAPEDSWVAKWQRITKMCKGMYALSVSGTLPKGIIKDLARQGISYKPRDTSQR
ncbi:transcription elongation factor SPT4-like [Anthonomus grandis grandis]|uniref:transcription elongation factor SPT4-like n=1 Tax=Anthonomus grandis grandis TaxID=2921223 RepID=UPI002166AE06|nr:transcription elongation factor SPT4-like [Anthonomus grandis grandis]